MKDLTVIYLTANKIPNSFAEYQRKLLLDSIGDYPLISFSRKHIDFGLNILDDAPICYSNIYKLLLRGAKLANTPFVAIAEDDSLYCKEHFNFYRPPLDYVAYNMSKWSLYTWNPIYSLKQRKTNATLIASRNYLIDALEERFAKYPDGLPDKWCGEVGRDRMERGLGVSKRNSVEVYSSVPVIQFSHPAGCDTLQLTRRKKLGALQAFDIPYWGKARELSKHYK